MAIIYTVPIFWQVTALIDEEKARYRPSLRQYLEPFPLPEAHPQARIPFKKYTPIITNEFRTCHS